MLLSELYAILEQVENFKNDFREVLKTELDARELGGENFHAQQIITEMEKTRIQIAQMIIKGNRDEVLVPA